MAPKPVTLRFLSDSSGMVKGFGAVDSKLKQFGTKLATTGKMLTLGLTVPLVAFGVKAVQEFSEAEQAVAQTNAAIKSTGGAANVSAKHVVSLADRVGELAAVDDELVQGAENILLTFTDIKNVGADKIFDQATLAVANLSARMDQDLQTSAVQVGKALNDPIKGLTSLGRIGVQFTEQQKEMIKRLVESGDKMGAQKIILAELNKEFGGSAKAAGEAASPITKLKLNLDNLAESIGAFVAPMFEKLSSFVKGLADGFKNLSPGVQDMIVKAGLIAAALGPVMFVVGKLINTIGHLTDAMRFLVAHPIVALIAIAALIILNWDKVSAFFGRLWKKIKEIFSGAIEFLKGAPVIGWFISAVGLIIDAWDEIKESFRKLWKRVKEIFSSALDFIVETVDLMLGPIDEIIGKIVDLIGKLGDLGGVVASGPGFKVVDGKLVPAARGFSGMVSKPTMFLAGEAGPEFVDIVPFGRGRGGGGGVANTYNYNLHVSGTVIPGLTPGQLARMFRRMRTLGGG